MIRTIVTAATAAAISLSLVLPAQAERSSRSAVFYVKVLSAEDVVRVRVTGGIAKPAPCQSENYMVFRLSNANAKTFLASLYTASATKGATVRLWGSDSCTIGTENAETINRIDVFPPK